MSTEEKYLAYVDVYELYTLFERSNLQCGKWRVQLPSSDQNATAPPPPIVKDFDVLAVDEHEKFESYVFYTQYISYRSCLHILDQIAKKSIEHNLHYNICAWHAVVRHLSKIFERIYLHLEKPT